MATLVNGKVLIIVGGDDMRYTFVNSTDYKSDNISAGVKYQLQAIHRTKVYHYNDTLDMLVVSKMPSMTTLRVQQSSAGYSSLALFVIYMVANAGIFYLTN